MDRYLDDFHGLRNSNLKLNTRREPLRSLKELADEFGIAYRSLTGLMKHHPGLNPVVRHKCRSTGQTSYYIHREARAWWAKVRETL